MSRSVAKGSFRRHEVFVMGKVARPYSPLVTIVSFVSSITNDTLLNVRSEFRLVLGRGE